MKLTLHVADTLNDPVAPGVFPSLSKQIGYRVSGVQGGDTPQTHVLSKHRFVNTSWPQGSDVPHLQVLRPTQVSAVSVHAGLQRANTKRGEK